MDVDNDHDHVDQSDPQSGDGYQDNENAPYKNGDGNGDDGWEEGVEEEGVWEDQGQADHYGFQFDTDSEDEEDDHELDSEPEHEPEKPDANPKLHRTHHPLLDGKYIAWLICVINISYNCLRKNMR